MTSRPERYSAMFYRPHGYDTITAQNGADGVRRLVDRAPCVIVLDSEMPGMDGHDFHEVQKVIAPDVPIICITGASNGEQAACRVGASSAHFKPLDLDALCRTVAHFCDLPHAHAHTELLESALEDERSAGLIHSRRTSLAPSSMVVPTSVSLRSMLTRSKFSRRKFQFVRGRVS
jgi:two-component system, chemotaxis family, chemotaxis protein CheY